MCYMIKTQKFSRHGDLFECPRSETESSSSQVGSQTQVVSDWVTGLIVTTALTVDRPPTKTLECSE